MDKEFEKELFEVLKKYKRRVRVFMQNPSSVDDGFLTIEVLPSCPDYVYERIKKAVKNRIVKHGVNFRVRISYTFDSFVSTRYKFKKQNSKT
jgi:hypothetical protein